MNTLPIFLSAAIAFSATLSAGLFVKKYKNHIGVVCALSAGFFIGISLFDLLPDIVTLAPQTLVSYYHPLLMAMLGFFLFLIFDRGFSKISHVNHEASKRTIRSTMGLMSTLEFCSHGFIEGLAIGVSFQFQFGLGLVVAVAVVSHNFCDGLSTLALMINSGNSLKSSMGLLFVDAIAPVLGAAASFIFSIQNYFLVFVLAFLAGSFIYIGGGNLLPDAYRMNKPSTTIILFLVGFALVLLLSRIINL